MSTIESHRKIGKTKHKSKISMWEIGLPKIALAATLFGTSAFAEEDLGQEWIGAMNACEALVSDQSFAGFQNYSDAQSILNVEPQLERGFQHPDLPLNASAISDGSEWFMCVVTGDTGNEQGEIIGTVTGTLLAQIRDYGNHTIVFEDGKTFAPVRVICQDDGQLTSVFAFYDEEQELRVAAINRLPDGADSPCR